MKPSNLVTQAPWQLYRKKASKLHNSRCKVDGITFDSQAEARRYVQLLRLQDVGQVKMFLRQPIFDLGGGTTYRADFLVFWSDGRVTVEDCKGYRTDAYIKAKKQVEALYPITIVESKA